MLLNYFALFVLILVFLILFYGVIIIHDIPYHIAQKRQHPHQDAIHVYPACYLAFSVDLGHLVPP